MKWPGIMAWGLLALAGMALIQPAPIMGAQELTVSAAASLTNAFPEIGQRFEQQHPGTKVIFNFAASGPLLQQIVQGAPVDVFASADQKTMDQAQEKGLIDAASRKNFVSNTLVLIVPQDSKLALSGPQGPGLSRGKEGGGGRPRHVCRRAAIPKRPWTKAGWWDKLSPKLILAESVRQVLDYVSRGEVDAGLVYSTDAAIAQGKVKPVATVKGHPAHRLSGGPGGGQSQESAGPGISELPFGP